MQQRDGTCFRVIALLILGLMLVIGQRAGAASLPACVSQNGLSNDAPQGLQPGDWPMFGHDPGRSFFNPDSCLRPDNVRKLVVRWFFRDPEDQDAITAQAVVANGVVYFGSWGGYFYAVNQMTGQLIWRFSVDCQNAIIPVPKKCLAPGQTPPPGRESSSGGLITSSAAVVGDSVIFGAGRTLYSLNVLDGSVRWKQVICGNPDDPACLADLQDQLRIISSPVVGGGNVYVGATVDGKVGYRGGLLAFDSTTGALKWRFEVDPVLDGAGLPILGANGLPAAGYNRGCGNIWSSPTLDTAHALVMFGTADCHDFDVPPYHDSILALDSVSGRLRWAFAANPGNGSGSDLDFGATGNLIDLPTGSYYGLGNKNGAYYLLDRLSNDPAGRVIWATKVVHGGDGGGFYGGAVFDGKRVIGATAYGEWPPQLPSLHAFNVAGGGVLWQDNLARTNAATTGGDGVVFVTTSATQSPFGPTLQSVNSSNGVRVRFDLLPINTNAPVTPARGMLFVPVGDYATGTQGGVIALALPSLPSNCVPPTPVLAQAAACR